jgi:hypothetical protein
MAIEIAATQTKSACADWVISISSEQDTQCSKQDAQFSEQDARTTARILLFLILEFKRRTA